MNIFEEKEILNLLFKIRSLAETLKQEYISEQAALVCQSIKEDCLEIEELVLKRSESNVKKDELTGIIQ